MSIYFFGLLQAFSEFLPVSSSGHLHLFQYFFGLSPSLSLDVWLNTATLLAVLVYFCSPQNPIRKLSFAGFFKLGFHLIIATFPAALFGLLFKGQIESLFLSPKPLALTFFITALALFSLRFSQKGRGELNFSKALLIGLAQSLALLPGVSRSALTITTALWLGLKKEEAFTFSFLLYIPASLGALFLTGENFNLLSMGSPFTVLTSFISASLLGYFSLLLLRRLLLGRTLWLFSFYCLGLSLFCLFL